jgi:putative ABC transport system substrate-binding protein
MADKICLHLFHMAISNSLLRKWMVFSLLLLVLQGCKNKDASIPVIAFADAFEDNTLKKARDGFFDALLDSGYDEKNKTLEVIYRNAQGNIPTLTQIMNYFIAAKPDLIATCPTISTINAVQLNKEIPVFMMVSGTPELMRLIDKKGQSPANLSGVGEQLDYIDSSFLLIPKIIKPAGEKLVVGMVFNQSEPQSVEAMNRIKTLAASNNMELNALPLNNSAEAQLVTSTLLSKQIDVFFANPDNAVFASFETIVKSCNESRVPILTSEAGLVERGALAAYGADIYQWGYQAGMKAAHYLKNKNMGIGKWEMVKIRKHIFNPKVSEKYGISLPGHFEAIP